jgi:cysteine desulfurase
MTIYFDNNATTRIHPQVLSTVSRHLGETFGNASSVHYPGRLARRAIEEAREHVARLIGADASEIVFTSGGTESNNAAIFGRAVGADPKRFHIVTTTIEHPSVAGVVDALESRGHPVTRVRPETSGRVSPGAVVDAIRDDTGLVAMMLANNETGVLQPVGEVGAVCRERGIPLHTDAVQAVGKIPVDVGTLGVDSLSLSGHKFYGPKGVGALWVRKGSKMEPYLIGGSQERRRRGGTENVPLIAGLGSAAEIGIEELDWYGREVDRLRNLLETKVREAVAHVGVHGAEAKRLPNTSSILLECCDSEAVVIGLDLEGIAVSSGSACSSGRVEPSRSLLEMGVAPRQARSTIRVSIGRNTTEEEVGVFVEVLQKVTEAAREADAVSA